MPKISPAVVKLPRRKPWLSPALMAATAPAPGEMLIAHDAAKKGNQLDHCMCVKLHKNNDGSQPAGTMVRCTIFHHES
jgi:hypothetical protein